MTTNPIPLENWFENNSSNSENFPKIGGDYFPRYQGIKEYLNENVYPGIGAALSSKDGGIYTDHGPKHFDAVIRYAGKLLGVPLDSSDRNSLCISPYEVFILLVSILLHDAGNIFGRDGHEKHPHQMFKEMGDHLCPDEFEAKLISQIASAHSGEVKLPNGMISKDSISQLKEKEQFYDLTIRQQLIAAVVRFADEICEDRSRCARFMLNQNALPKQSEVHHAYANSISNVSVDREGKSVSLKFELRKADILKKHGKGTPEHPEEVFLTDEIFSRLEKMHREMIYCQRYMSECIKLDRIRATIEIYDEQMQLVEVGNNSFELKEIGYPTIGISLCEIYPEWVGFRLKQQLDSSEDYVNE